MKHRFPILLALLFSLQGLAQVNTYYPFAGDSAQWTLCYFNQNSGNPNTVYPCSYTHYRAKGHSIVNGKHYTNIFQSYDGHYTSANETFDCYIRQDSTEKVYVKYPYSRFQDSSEFLLYDFSLRLNDKMPIKHLDPNNPNTLLNDTLMVFSVDSQLINGTYRKRFRMVLATMNANSTFTQSSEWVEGIGSDMGLLYPEMFSFFEFQCSLVCYGEKGNYFIGGPNCSTSVDVKPESMQLPVLSVYPNPASDNFVIEAIHAPSPLRSLEIFNLQGQLLKTIAVSGEKIHLSREDFQEGCYLYKVTDSTGLFGTGKFVIQH